MDHKTSGHNRPSLNLQGIEVDRMSLIHAAHPYHHYKHDVIFLPWCMLNPNSPPHPDHKTHMPMNSNPEFVTCKWCANRIAEWRVYQGREPPMTGYNYSKQSRNFPTMERLDAIQRTNVNRLRQTHAAMLAKKRPPTQEGGGQHPSIGPQAEGILRDDHAYRRSRQKP